MTVLHNPYTTVHAELHLSIISAKNWNYKMISAKQEHKIPFKAMDSNLTYTAKQPSKTCSQTLTYRALRHLKAVLYPVAMSHHNKHRIGNECSWLSL